MKCGWRAGPTGCKELPRYTIPSTALIPPNNLSRNVTTHLEEAKNRLSALATVYLVTEVAGQSPAMLDAKRRDLQRFLAYKSNCAKIPSFTSKTSTAVSSPEFDHHQLVYELHESLLSSLYR